MSVNGRMMPDGVTAVRAEYLPINAEWLRPEETDESKAILYFHGGGYAMDNVKSYRSNIGNFVSMVGYKALLFDYHLDPEFPTPAAVNDSAAIYLWMLEQGYHPEDIIFAGHSAGGGIEIGTLIKLRDEGVPLPAACVAFSPSYISPFIADLTGLPPTMIHVAENEVLRDDATSFGERADFFGVDVRVKIWKGRFHGFPLLAPMVEETTEAMTQVNSFIKHNMHKERGITAAYLYMTMLLHI